MSAAAAATPPDGRHALLLAEDDLVLAVDLCVVLERHGYLVTHAPDGASAFALARSQHFDVMVIDRMLPGMDGLDLLKQLRLDGHRMPALFLTALARVDERIRGLQAGADDYLTKPFEMDELLVRLEVIQRRIVPESAETVLELGPLRLDLLERRAFRNGRELGLQGHEFLLLAFLVRHHDRLVTRDTLLEKVWNYRFIPDSNVVSVHVSNLRRKLELPGDSALIHTVRGQGFVLRLPR
jgi:two-component system OmpR family response regulator